MAAIAREFDLVTSWNKFCSNALILSVHSLMSLSIYAESWLPWPYANRSLILKALACDVLDQHGCYCIIMEQIEELDEEKTSRLKLFRSERLYQKVQVLNAMLKGFFY